MTSSLRLCHVRAGQAFESGTGEREKRRARPLAPSPNSALIGSAAAAEAGRVQKPVRFSDFNVPEIVLSVNEEIPSNLGLLEGAAAKITTVIQRATRCKECEWIGLAIREAIANAVVHGNRCDPSKTVHLSVSVNNVGDLLVTVRDSGSGFDPDHIADPTAPRNLLSDHGRGVFLMKQIMDQVDFYFNHGTEVRMYKRRCWLE